jgi:hypothetical protein
MPTASTVLNERHKRPTAAISDRMNVASVLKKMKSTLLLLSFIACAASKLLESGPLEDFLQQLGTKWQQSICQKVSQSSIPSGDSGAFEKCLQDTRPLTAEIISEFRPIALQVVENAVSDVNDTTVDRETENLNILTTELDLEFKHFLDSKLAPPVNQGSQGGLDKRRVYTGWTKNLKFPWKSGIKANVKQNAGKKSLWNRIKNFRFEKTEVNIPKDSGILGIKLVNNPRYKPSAGDRLWGRIKSTFGVKEQTSWRA